MRYYPLATAVPHSSTIIAAANDHERHVHLAEAASSKGDLSLFWHHARMASAAARTFELVTRKRLGGDGEKMSGDGSDNNIEECPPAKAAISRDGSGIKSNLPPSSRADGASQSQSSTAQASADFRNS